MARGDDGTAMKFKRLFDTSKRQQPTQSQPIRSKPVIVPVFPDAPLQISNLKNMPRDMPKMPTPGASNSEPKQPRQSADMLAKAEAVQDPEIAVRALHTPNRMVLRNRSYDSTPNQPSPTEEDPSMI